MLNKSDFRNFFDTAHLSIDRNKVLDCIVTMNFVDFLSLQFRVPKLFILNNLELFSSKTSLRMFISNEQGETVKLFEPPTTIDLFENKKLATFLFRADVSGILGSHKLIGDFIVDYDFNEYLTSVLIDPAIADTQLQEYGKLKVISDHPVSAQRGLFRANNLYGIEFGMLNILDHKCVISPIYDVYEKTIPADVVLGLGENARSFKLVDALSGHSSGAHGNSNQILMSILQNSYFANEYEEYAFEQNIFIEPETAKKRDLITPSYESLGTGLEVAACSNNLFVDTREQGRQKSDILMLATYFNNIADLDINDDYKNDLKLVPDYVLNILSKPLLWYLKEIDADSLSEAWGELTNFELQNLKPGNYLCKITSQEAIVNKFLIETQFVLVK